MTALTHYLTKIQNKTLFKMKMRQLKQWKFLWMKICFSALQRKAVYTVTV